MAAAVLLAAVTLLYAGYNLLVKLSGAHVPAAATTTVLAAVCLQAAALSTSALFLAFQAVQGGHVFALAPRAYAWAVLAGVCIGAAEIGYFHLFGGVGLDRPMRAGVAIPVVVAGTVAIAAAASALVFGEAFGRRQLAGAALVAAGVVLILLEPGALR